MAVPSRVFVGLLVFGLIASLAILPYTLLVLSGYEPDGGSALLPQPAKFTFGDKLALVLGSLFSLALTVVAWRGLLTGARRDARRRKERAAAPPTHPPEDEPPGYH